MVGNKPDNLVALQDRGEAQTSVFPECTGMTGTQMLTARSNKLIPLQALAVI